MTPRRPRPAFLLLVLVLALLACKKKQAPPPPKPYVPTATSVGTYQSLCETPTRPVLGTPYKLKADQVSKLVVFQKYLDDKKPSYKLTKQDRLGAWSDPKMKAGDVELVVCVEMKKKKKAQGVCSYMGGKIEPWEMSHSVRVIEATTGKEVLKEEFDLGADAFKCPATSRGGNYFEGSDYSTKLVSLMAKLQPSLPELPETRAFKLDAVCDGVPFPQTAAYDKGSNEKRDLRVAWRPAAEYSYFDETPFERRLASSQGVSKHQLVACVTGKPKKKKRDCRFMTKTLEMWDGEVEVELRESATAKVVETKVFKASSGRCPATHKFWKDREIYMGTLEPAFFKYLDTLEGG
ncbi:MAG TPA: hypothetical protein PKD61_30770 [Polyangiaceae bacterium]|nr:hypothetical protein [Polyangiaceae bacterium]